MNLYSLVQPLLFAQNAEEAHHIAFVAMGVAGGALVRLIAPSEEEVEKNPITLAGLRFRNRVGLAAGFDKNALRLKAWERLGFGHVEIGTVTPRPQPGNAKPRLFRLPADGALINRMGFNNDGADAIRLRLENRPSPTRLIVGGNIGKNKDTLEEVAYLDYVRCLERLHDAIDYVTVNISSPNTQGLRSLQAREPLLRLLSEVQNYNAGLAVARPIFVKIAPDLSGAALEDIVEVAVATGMAGLVVTNTTLSREGLSTPRSEVEAMGAGGLSGAPLTDLALAFCRKLGKMLPSELALIASGGIMKPEDATARMQAGARLVQIYSGFVYRGPALVPEIVAASLGH